MQNILHKPSLRISPGSGVGHSVIADVKDRLSLRYSPGQPVFRAGDERHVYRVETGAICHFSDKLDGRFSVLEVAFPDHLIGLGTLRTHTSSAMAMVDCTVVPISAAELELALLSDDRLSYAMADAGQRDFDYLRAKSVGVAPLPPVRRLANYLLAVLGITRDERGAGDLLISDDLTSGFVAQQLHMTIDVLASSLLILRRSGIVDVSPRGLRVINMRRLEMVADAS